MKKSLICKNIQNVQIDESKTQSYLPKVGDVALFKVKKIGKHTRIQNHRGKNQYLFPGDYILCAFGNRYATNQIEGYVPEEIHDEYHILGQGGVVGIVKSMYKPIEEKGPTTLELIGYATNPFGRVLNTLAQSSTLEEEAEKNAWDSKIILSLGSAMDSGKTTTAGYLCRGLGMADKKVAYMKLTGTIYTKDASFAIDCGAHTSIDFSHFGYPSTYMCDQEELLLLFSALLGSLSEKHYDYIVVEIADGLLQRETGMLLQNPHFMRHIDDVIFSAGDSLGVISGLDVLSKWGIHPFAVSGKFTARPLLIEEVAACRDIDVLRLEDLEKPEVLNYFEYAKAYVQQEVSVQAA